YYSFRVIDHMNDLSDPLTVAVLKTSAWPINVSVTSQTPASPTANDAVVVSIATNQPKSPEERIYLRWSNDFFITSNIVEATGSSHTIATTSPQSGGTGVQYVWKKWSDSGSISHTVAPTTNKTYTATFTTQYYLTMSAATGGTVSPSSGWRNSGASVSISATPI